jgi:hypothetical protein
MDKNDKSDKTSTSVVVVDVRATGTTHTNLTSLVAFDLAAETASLEAGQVSQTLAAASLSLTNLQPGAMPKLLLP